MKQQGVRFTNIDPPEDNGCDGCGKLKNLRLLCPEHRQKRTCPWCAGKGFCVTENRWVQCGCRTVILALAHAVAHLES